jgi:hypothetical protein
MSTTVSARIKSTARTAAIATTMGAAALAGAAAVGLTGTANAEMFGDPVAAAEYWQPQHYDDCTLMAVADVVGQINHVLVSERQIIDVAKNTPSEVHPGSIYIKPADVDDPNTGNGTDARDVVVLLDHFGVHGVITDGEVAAQPGGLPTGLAPLMAYLDGGQKVIARVNAETIWNMEGDRTQSDHAVVVTGIDSTKGVVHLNDSGVEDGGQDEQVSIATFAAAWATSDNSMIVTLEAS